MTDERAIVVYNRELASFTLRVVSGELLKVDLHGEVTFFEELDDEGSFVRTALFLSQSELETLGKMLTYVLRALEKMTPEGRANLERIQQEVADGLRRKASA